jgi:hypothetical protein
MILISHRGNIEGSIPEKENDPRYVEDAISFGFDVEVDVWYVQNDLWLGHDKPQFKTNFDWFKDRIDKLWVHCKNKDSLIFFRKNFEKNNFNFFWHQQDDLTLTSLNYIWVYPGKQPILDSISVIPELYGDDISLCLGVCSDYIKKYNI